MESRSWTDLHAGPERRVSLHHFLSAVSSEASEQPTHTHTHTERLYTIFVVQLNHRVDSGSVRTFLPLKQNEQRGCK